MTALVPLHTLKRNRRIGIGLEEGHSLTLTKPDGTSYPITELNFYHIDGMYSYCVTDEGDVVHLGATEMVYDLGPM